MQGDVIQDSSLPHPAACSSPKLQPGACCGGKSTRLLQRKTEEETNVVAKEQEGGFVAAWLKQMGISCSKRQSPGSGG